MRVIFKYKLPSLTNVIKFPVGFKIIHVGSQLDGTFEVPMVWAEVDTDAIEADERLITAIPTGFSEVPSNADHIGTLISKDTSTVFHYYLSQKNASV